MNQILAQMGIMQWQERIPLPGAKREWHWSCYRLLGGEEPALVVFERNLGQPVDKVEALLHAMMKAIRLELGAEVPYSEAEVKNTGWVLTMGEQACEKFDGTVAVLQHPVDLLNEPSLKAKAWDVLKKLL